MIMKAERESTRSHCVENSLRKRRKTGYHDDRYSNDDLLWVFTPVLSRTTLLSVNSDKMFPQELLCYGDAVLLQEVESFSFFENA